MWADACRGLRECRREGDDDADGVPLVPLRTEEPELPCSPLAGRMRASGPRLPSLPARLWRERSDRESSATDIAFIAFRNSCCSLASRSALISALRSR